LRGTTRLLFVGAEQAADLPELHLANHWGEQPDGGQGPVDEREDALDARQRRGWEWFAVSTAASQPVKGRAIQCAFSRIANLASIIQPGRSVCAMGWPPSSSRMRV